MADIVQKLRAYRPRYGWPEEYSTIVEPTMNHVAADEIERLRAEVEEQARLNGMGAERELAAEAEIKRLRAERDAAVEHVLLLRESSDYYKSQECMRIQNEICAENERLRKALKTIVDLCDGYQPPAHLAAKIARAALGEEKKG